MIKINLVYCKRFQFEEAKIKLGIMLRKNRFLTVSYFEPFANKDFSLNTVNTYQKLTEKQLHLSSSAGTSSSDKECGEANCS